MATQTYVNGQLIKITLTGTWAEIDRLRVRGFIAGDQGLSANIFNYQNVVDTTEYDEAAANWYNNRVASADAIADSDTTTITIYGNSFRIPNTLITAVGKTESELTDELTDWLSTIVDTSIDPYATVTQTDPLPSSAVTTA